MFGKRAKIIHEDCGSVEVDVVQWITAKQDGIGSETVQNSKQFSAKYPGQCRTVHISNNEQ
jgi:hypothetical protein